MSLYIGSDFDVCYLGAKDSISGTYLTTGTCTYQLTRQGSSTVIAFGSLTYQSGSVTINGTTYPDGNYFGTIDATVTATLTPKVNYTIKIVFSQDTYDDVRYLTEVAYYRGAT